MAKIPDRDLVEFRVKLARTQRDRLEKYARWSGHDMVDLVRSAVIDYLEVLDEKQVAASKKPKVFVPDHANGKPQGLGPIRAPSTKKVDGPPPPPPSPFAALAPPPYVVSDKVKRAFRNWAEYLEEADGLVDTERRAKKIVDDLKERVEEKDVKPCYEAFVDFCETRKAMKEKPMVTVGDVPIVGDV